MGLIEVFQKLLMEVSINPQTLLIGVVVGLGICLSYLTSLRNKFASLPGPLCLPYFGSIFALPKMMSITRKDRTLIEFAKRYGDLFAISIGETQLVFLNDLQLIKEAFISKGELVSDRLSPTDPLTVVISGGKGIISTNLGKEYRERKSLSMQSMKDFGLRGTSIDETVIEEANLLTRCLHQYATGQPTDAHCSLIAQAVSNVISSVVFGKRFSYDDEEFKTTVAGIQSILMNGSGLLQKIPFATLLPYVRRRQEESLKQARQVLRFIDQQIQIHQEQYDGGTPKDFIDLWLESAGRDGNHNSAIGTDNIKKIIVDLFMAGTDTTAVSLLWFVLYMIHFPEVQRKCQQEIDGFVESDARPGVIGSSKSLPFTTACLHEVQRMTAVAGVGLGHKVRENVMVGGHLLKKGSLVFPNIRFLHMDERHWENPGSFRPERWLDSSHQFVQHLHFIPFSLGKRRCLGENLAKVEYSGFAVALLRNFTFSMADPANPPSLAGRGSVIYSPHPFHVVMEARSHDR